MSDAPPDRPTAVLGRRYLSYLIDVLVYYGAAAAAFWFLAERSTEEREEGARFIARLDREADETIRIGDRVFAFDNSDVLLIIAIALGVTLLFDVLVQGRFGWTIGKALTGIRTVKADGGRPGIGRALLRTLFIVLDAIPSLLVPLVGGVLVLATRDNRRLGDLVAGTYVVHRSAVGEDPTASVSVDTSGWEPDAGAPVTTLSQGESLRVGKATQRFPADRPDDVSAPGTATEKLPAYQPQWDPARQAYLQWDPRKQTWLQFDDDAQEWRPIG